MNTNSPCLPLLCLLVLSLVSNSISVVYDGNTGSVTSNSASGNGWYFYNASCCENCNISSCISQVNCGGCCGGSGSSNCESEICGLCGTFSNGNQNSQVYPFSSGTTTSTLTITGFSFSMMPSEATINGIEASLTVDSPFCSSNNNEWQISSLSIPYSSSSSYSINGLPSIDICSETTLTFGNNTDNWGNSNWPVSYFTEGNFELQIQGTAINNQNNHDVANYYSCSVTVYYSLTVNINSILPSSMYGTTGDISISIIGGFFYEFSSIQCEVGGSPGTVTAYNSSVITCQIPSAPGNLYGSYLVSISLDGGNTWTDNSVYFAYECNPDQCNGHGNCTQNGNCICDFGWEGQTCNTPNCSTLNNCNGRGTCVAGPSCNCNSGYTGSSCNEYSCEELENCNGHGTCTGPNTCTCNTGWYTSNCSLANCSAEFDCNAKAGGGECVSPGNCSCNTNYSLPDCTHVCTPNCTVNQYCSEDYTCVCLPGWAPPNCTSRYSCKAVNNCSGNGVCIGNETCSCSIGWLGSACDTADCSPYNCSGHGKCIQPYTCQCDSGWENGICSSPVCNSSVNNCNILYGGGTCIRPNVCNCSAGWNGTNCSEPICNNCTKNQECVAPGLCYCLPGYSLPSCTPIYSCASLGDCSIPNGECVGENNCSCKTGWNIVANCSVANCQNLNNCYSNEGHGFCESPGVCVCLGDWGGIECNETNGSSNSTAGSPCNTSDADSVSSGQVVPLYPIGSVSCGTCPEPVSVLCNNGVFNSTSFTFLSCNSGSCKSGYFCNGNNCVATTVVSSSTVKVVSIHILVLLAFLIF